MSTPPSHRKCWRSIATDDNTSKLSALTENLRDAGHWVFAAYDGQSALELVSLLPNVRSAGDQHPPGCRGRARADATGAIVTAVNATIRLRAKERFIGLLGY